MARTIEEVKDILIARYDPDQLMDLLEPEIEELVEGCHDIIVMQMDKLQVILGEDDASN